LPFGTKEELKFFEVSIQTPSSTASDDDWSCAITIPSDARRIAKAIRPIILRFLLIETAPTLHFQRINNNFCSKLGAEFMAAKRTASPDCLRAASIIWKSRVFSALTCADRISLVLLDSFAA
jgi:hypothetical protein